MNFLSFLKIVVSVLVEAAAVVVGVLGLLILVRM